MVDAPFSEAPVECDVCGAPILPGAGLQCEECNAPLCNEDCEREHMCAELEEEGVMPG